MARKPRVHYQGAFYHVIVRGNNRAYIFKSKDNKEEYKKIVSNWKMDLGQQNARCCLIEGNNST